jgi:hypothetical protein
VTLMPLKYIVARLLAALTVAAPPETQCRKIPFPDPL